MMDLERVASSVSNGFSVMKHPSDCAMQDGHNEHLKLTEEYAWDTSEKGVHNKWLSNKNECSAESHLKSDIGGLTAQVIEGHVKIDNDDDDDNKVGILDSGSKIQDASFSHSLTKKGSSPRLLYQTSKKLGHAPKRDVSAVLYKNTKNERPKPMAVRRLHADSTVLQPFNRTAKKLAVTEGNLGDHEYGQQLKKSQRLASNLQLKSSFSSTDSQMEISDTSKHSGVVKHFSFRRDVDIDDNGALVSSNKTDVPILKEKSSQSFSIKAFKLQSDERAEKRKEFYSKLQEKMNAKEEEKAEMLMKMKKDLEEEIKILRKRLEFKASPMPSFYQEGPTKTELPKIPPTRAKSPNFSGRHSHPRVLSRPCSCSTDCEAEHRNINSSHKSTK